MTEIRFMPRAGALRYKDENDKWVCANPRDLMFSTVTMLATEYWSIEKGWTKIYENDDAR